MESFDLNAMIESLLPNLRRTARSSITFKKNTIRNARTYDKADIETAIVSKIKQAALGGDTTVETYDSGKHLHVLINGVCEVQMVPQPTPRRPSAI